MREFKFLYTTDDNSLMSECICGAPGALRLKTVYWFVNSCLYKTEKEQEMNKFKIGTSCAYWLQLDPIMYNKRGDSESPFLNFKPFHIEGLLARFCEEDSEIDQGIFAFFVHSSDQNRMIAAYNAVKDSYNFKHCVEIHEYSKRMKIYVNQSDFCSGYEVGILDDGEIVRLKFRVVIVEGKPRFELIHCQILL
jgi:hypothetical protein